MIEENETNRCWLWWSLVAVLLIGSYAAAADVVLMVGDQSGGGDAGFRDGDIISVYDDAEIARQWAEVDARGEAHLWEGYDRSRAPLSDTMLSRFLVVSIDNDVAAKMKHEYVKSITTLIDGTEVVTAKRRYRWHWRGKLSAKQIAVIASGSQVFNARALRVRQDEVEDKLLRIR